MSHRRIAVVAIAVLAAAGCSSSKGASPNSSTNTSTSSTTAATTTATTTTTTTTKAPAGAHVGISMTPTVAARGLTMPVVVDGVVPRLSDAATGQPVTGPEQVLNTRVDYGDGSLPGGSDGGAVACKAGAPLVPLHMTWANAAAFTHTYAKAGSYTVTVSVRVCGLGTVSRHMKVSVG